METSLFINETWSPIKGYEDAYEVSTFGQIRSISRVDNRNKLYEGKVLKLRREKQGYLRVGLYKNGKSKVFLVHRLVAEAFIPNKSHKKYVNHKDANKENNRVENLEWCTASENTLHAHSLGLMPQDYKHSEMSIIGVSVNNEYESYYFKSVAEASRYGFNATRIYNWLCKKVKTPKDFVWYKADELHK